MNDHLRALGLLALSVFLCSACDKNEASFKWHRKFKWEASQYFSDRKVVELCHAIELNDIKSMEKLLKGGADPDARGKHGMTPLLWAFPENRLDAFRLLLEHGANPNVLFQDGFGTRGGISIGDSVTMLAARSAFPEHLGWVLKFGGDPNLRA